jgi:hypothetical protein
MLPLKLDEASGHLILSKNLRRFNQFLSFLFVLTSPMGLYFLIEMFVQLGQSAKALVGVLAISSCKTFIAFNYIFVMRQQENLKNVFNNLIKLSSKFLKNDLKVDIFSRLLIFQLVTLHPLFYSYWTAMFCRICITRSIGVVLFTFEICFVYSSRLFTIFVCFMIDLNSKLMKTESEKPANVHQVLQLTQQICKLFNSYVFVFVFVQHLFVLIYTFGIFSHLAAKIVSPSYDFEFVGFLIQLLMMMVDTCNLMTFMRSCKIFKKNVRRIRKFKPKHQFYSF